MAVYQLVEEQMIPAPVNEVWAFISNPANLRKITPPHMGFVIKSTLPEKMYPGMIIRYKVSPLLNIPLTWVTEITQIEHEKFFIDVQLAGPYALWHHQHILIAQGPDEVLMKDIVTYQPPLGPLGSLANTFIIKKQLRKIFDYRKVAIENQFPF